MWDRHLWGLRTWVRSRAYLAHIQHDYFLGPYKYRRHSTSWKYMRREAACQGWAEYEIIASHKPPPCAAQLGDTDECSSQGN